MSPSPDRTELAREAWRAGADERPDRLPGFPTPRAGPRVEQKLTSLPGLNKGGNAKILGKQRARAPAWRHAQRTERAIVLELPQMFRMGRRGNHGQHG